MASKRFLLLLILLTCFAPYSRADASSKWQILQAGGPFHGDEIKADLSLSWYGLYEDHGGYVLKKVNPEIRREKDPILDTGARKTGKRIVVKFPQGLIFLVGTSRSLPEDSVDGEVPQPSYLDPASSQKLEVERRVGLLSAEGSPKVSSTGRWWLKDKRLQPYRMLLSEGDRSQVLLEVDSLFRGSFLTGPGAYPYLVWYGDLDGDGRIDLLLNQASDNITHWILYLSSEAKSGDLVGKVAELMMTGC